MTEFVQLQVPRAVGYGFPPDEIYMKGFTDINFGWYLKKLKFSGVYVTPLERRFAGMSRYAMEDRPYNWTKCEDNEVTLKIDNPEWITSADGVKYRLIGFKNYGINDSATWYEKTFCSWSGRLEPGVAVVTRKHEYDQYTMVVEKYKEKE